MDVECHESHCSDPGDAAQTDAEREELEKNMTNNSRVIPIYEKAIFEDTFKKKYSFPRNAKFKNAFANYLKNVETRVFKPFEFPNARDFHFYNNAIRFLPSETDFRRNSFRQTLAIGPGVDNVGPLPIPQELLMRRGNKNWWKLKKLG